MENATLKFKVRCDDNVIRVMLINFDIDQETGNYTVTTNEDFITAFVDMFHEKRYTGLVDVVFTKGKDDDCYAS